MRLALVEPFIDALHERGIDTISYLQNLGINPATIQSQAAFVPQNLIHQILESAAEVTRDPYFAVRVAERLDLSLWGPLREALPKAASLIDFLICFVEEAHKEASSADQRIEINARFCVYRECRTTPQSIVPAQNDAFTTSLLTRIVSGLMGSAWNAAQVQVSVSDPSALPLQYRGMRIQRGDRQGVQIRFPTSWLNLSVEPLSAERSFPGEGDPADIPTDFLGSFRLMLETYLPGGKIDLVLASQLAGMSPQCLQRMLRRHQTTFSQELARVKLTWAQQQLHNSDQLLSGIAREAGYSSTDGFSRAYKKYFGANPSRSRRE